MTGLLLRAVALPSWAETFETWPSHTAADRPEVSWSRRVHFTHPDTGVLHHVLISRVDGWTDNGDVEIGCTEFGLPTEILADDWLTSTAVATVLASALAEAATLAGAS